jgi:hypothetical protein
MNEYDIDPISWFSRRELQFTPPHFVVTQTTITTESKAWILSTLKGRFSIVFLDEVSDDYFSIVSISGCPAFENPQEALAYELKWA